ncbi:MAG: helix-turn-helix transcriptional regulator [Burkholderiales bacterium]|jgi:putative molybdopterin biosynthesis protein|nr:helix-turn-helix transcriptional regulator [Burkholderiales bacterium]HQY07337.1 substrate-binding domain-containing protein [Burkholderiaceae bacterium]
MLARGVHLQYSFETDGQRGAQVQNPLFDLLTAVKEGGSIQHAAKSLGASYRHVWGQLKHWEEVLGEPLLTWTQGQPSRLTPFADRLLWAETQARTRLTPHIEALRAELERVLSEALDGSQQVLTIYASHDLALPILRDAASRQHRLHIDLRFAGSVDALRALAEGRCLVAGFHVPPQHDRGDVFAHSLRPLLKPGRHKLIGCVRRTQGLMVAPGNPLGLRGLADLVQASDAASGGVGRGGPRGAVARFVNRQAGSGTRLLLDHLLEQAGLDATQICGYQDQVENSHLAVAAAVASGAGDAALGVEAAARQFGLDFLPLLDEDYHLVCLKDALTHPAVLRLREQLASPEWPALLADLPGYAASHSGQVLSLIRALPWWSFRLPKPVGLNSPALEDAGDLEDDEAFATQDPLAPQRLSP